MKTVICSVALMLCLCLNSKGDDTLNAKSKLYGDVIIHGFEVTEARDEYPVGKIKIMSVFESQTTPPNPTAMIFINDYLERLQRFQRLGLITITEIQQNPMEVMVNNGARFFNITPSDRLLAVIDKSISTDHWLRATRELLKLSKLVKDSDYSLIQDSNEYRLVLGTLIATRTKAGMVTMDSLGFSFGSGDPPPVEEKFRAILKHDPFNDTFSFVTGDIGRLTDGFWYTQNVR